MITGMLTPQGLKIRLDGGFCEQLPYIKDKSVNDILVDTELYVCLSKWLIFLAGIIAFFAKLPNNTLFLLAFTITIIMSVSFWIHPVFSLIRGTVFLTQPKIFITITGWFLDKIILAVIGFLTVGWQGLLFYAAGYIVATLLGFILNVFLAKSKHSQFGVALQSDENVFIYLSLRYLERISYMDWIKAYYNYLNSDE